MLELAPSSSLPFKKRRIPTLLPLLLSRSRVKVLPRAQQLRGTSVRQLILESRDLAVEGGLARLDLDHDGVHEGVPFLGEGIKTHARLVDTGA